VLLHLLHIALDVAGVSMKRMNNMFILSLRETGLMVGKGVNEVDNLLDTGICFTALFFLLTLVGASECITATDIHIDITSLGDHLGLDLSTYSVEDLDHGERIRNDFLIAEYVCQHLHTIEFMILPSYL
jgi:hypothetical protein